MERAIPEQVFVLKRANRRTIALHIDRNGALEVRAPTWVARRDIVAFVSEKASWIAAQRQKLAAAPPFEQPVFSDGGFFRLFGQRMAIRVDADRCVVVCETLITEGPDAVQTPAFPELSEFELSFRGSPGPGTVRTVIRRAMRARLDAYIDARIAHWRSHDAFKDSPVLQVKIRLMRRRWGSCRRNGTLTFSETLAKYPARCADAVIVHELCHLRHFNHGPAFYALMTEVMPQWREADSLLDAESKRY
jgi:predicted metal-dependent hydrolase